MQKLSLNSHWNVRWEELHWGPGYHRQVAARKEGWLSAQLPCDIHMALLEHGLIKEPLEADNFLECEWTEEKSWWFKNVFPVDAAFLGCQRMELTLDGLDAEADIFLNGVHLGRHRSAYYPFVCDAKPYLLAGDNELLIRLTSGLEHYSDADTALVAPSVSIMEPRNRGDRRRPFVRKPAYVYGWDWGPRIATCGIMKEASLVGYGRAAIRAVRAYTAELAGEGGTACCAGLQTAAAKVPIELEIENFHPYETADALIHVQILDGDRCVWEWQEAGVLRSGLNYVALSASLQQAKLWWPSGMGAQPLYTVQATAVLQADGQTISYPAFQLGIRTVRLDQSRINERERLFAVEINGVRTFCKGGNWIPCDSIYARVDADKYSRLIAEAQEANFNMLRVWGGGIYEADAFYELCDAKGIMVWQDFMFACGLYPDELPWFRQEVEAELDYQTKRLRNHPSVALWCGNNENAWAFDEWWPQITQEGYYGGASIYNEMAPKAVRRNCPDIPYWNSSPYGGAHPNGSDQGDRHHWHDCTMHPEMEKRIVPEEYDKVTAKFVSEYGYIGPCRRSTIERYHGGAPLDRSSQIWAYHNNTYEKETVAAGIAKHYTDPAALDLDGYLLYAGLCQGLMYSYSLEAFRYKEHCSGALFWMYNDCWGEVGWTIIDYYLTRKISYYYVKRAFAPVKFILRLDASGVANAVGINDTGETVELEAEYGYVSGDGLERHTRTAKLVLPPHSRQLALTIPAQGYDLKRGVVFVRPLGATAQADAACLRTGVFRELQLPEPALEISDFRHADGETSFCIASTGFAHAVHFNLGDRVQLSDEYFDLLPGESKRITVYGADPGLSAESLAPAYIRSPAGIAVI